MTRTYQAVIAAGETVSAELGEQAWGALHFEMALTGEREPYCGHAFVAATEALHDPESPSWTARDVYAHLARWIERSTTELESWVANRTLLPKLEGDDDTINARWQAEDAALSFAEARSRAQAWFDRRIAAIEAVPADRWDAVAEACARADGSTHYRGHRGYVRT
jgi:hypothetical protein